MKRSVKIVIGTSIILLVAGIIIAIILAVKPEIFGLNAQAIVTPQPDKINSKPDSATINEVTTDVGDSAVPGIDGVGGTPPEGAPPRIDGPMSSRDPKDEEVLNPLFINSGTQLEHPVCELEPDGVWAKCYGRRHKRWLYNTGTVAETIVNCTNHYQAVECPPKASFSFGSAPNYVTIAHYFTYRFKNMNYFAVSYNDSKFVMNVVCINGNLYNVTKVNRVSNDLSVIYVDKAITTDAAVGTHVYLDKCAL